MLYNSDIMPSRNRIFLSGLAVLIFAVSGPAMAHAASYTLVANKGTFVVGDSFMVDLKINSADVGINAAQATLSFPKDKLQVVTVDKTSSVFNFWLQGPDYSNDAGTVSFIGGNQNGLAGTDLEVLRVTFKVTAPGPVALVFTDGAVTASDGSGTNVLSAMNGLQLTSITTQDATLIKPPQIVRPAVPTGVLPVKPSVTVPLYPDSAAWYAHVSPFIAQWTLPKDVTSVATAVDRQPAFDPTASGGLFDNETFDPLEDGIWYLHVRFRNAIGWGPTLHYRIGIDTAPPLDFSVASPDGLVTENVAPSISFLAKDQPSGILDYKILVDGTLATTTLLTAYTLPPQAPGKHDILVQAYDRAGNMTESRMAIDILEAPLITIAGIRITQFGFYVTIILFLIGGLLLGRYLDALEHQRRRRRIIIAQRDVQAVTNLVKKDLEGLIAKCDDKAMSQEEVGEMRSVLLHAVGTAEKFEKYLVQNVEEIEK